MVVHAVTEKAETSSSSVQTATANSSSNGSSSSSSSSSNVSSSSTSGKHVEPQVKQEKLPGSTSRCVHLSHVYYYFLYESVSTRTLTGKLSQEAQAHRDT